MNKKRLEAIAAIIILLALIVLVVFLLLKKQDVKDVTPNGNVTTTNELPVVAPEDVPEPQAVSAQTVSRVFVERFGSYSSESDFQNISDILDLSTPAFQTQLQGLIADQRSRQPDGYYGVSTFVISSKVIAESDTAMTLLITTQRREAVGSPGNSTTRYQDIEVKLEKIAEDWLIAGYTWK